MKPTEIAALALGGLLIAGGTAILVQNYLAPAPLPAKTASTERALAFPGLLAITTVDVEDGFGGNHAQQGITEEFKAFVVLPTSAAVGKRLLQQFRV